ncbi:MAG: HIT domain-containing protein [Actinobacteria bacterium]|nr:HIT domain-containing protein [Actinomycetota bacterium]
MEDDECVFCRVVSGALPHSVISEDGATVAFMANRQQRVGHVLVVPRAHIETVFDLDERTGAAVMAMTVRIARAVKAAFQPEGLHLWQSNGPGAGQEVPHFHMHVMPRWFDDGLIRWHPEHGPIYPERDELDRQAARILAALTKEANGRAD